MKTKIAQIACMLALFAIVAIAFASALDKELSAQECANVQHAYLAGAFDAIPDDAPINKDITRIYANMLNACNK